jgi:hypothetical protein
MQQRLTNAPLTQGIPKVGLKLLADCIIGNLTTKADQCKAATKLGRRVRLRIQAVVIRTLAGKRRSPSRINFNKFLQYPLRPLSLLCPLCPFRPLRPFMSSKP